MQAKGFIAGCVCVGGLEQKGGKKKKLAGKKVFGALDNLDTFYM